MTTPTIIRTSSMLIGFVIIFILPKDISLYINFISVNKKLVALILKKAIETRNQYRPSRPEN